MEDREEKLSKAREKLDKFRKKKQRNPESVVSVVGDEGQSKESSSTSPEVLQAPDQVSQDQQHPTNELVATVPYLGACCWDKQFFSCITQPDII